MTEQDKSTLMQLLMERVNDCQKGSSCRFTCSKYNTCALITVADEVRRESVADTNRAIDKLRKSQQSQDYTFEKEV